MDAENILITMVFDGVPGLRQSSDFPTEPRSQGLSSGNEVGSKLQGIVVMRGEKNSRSKAPAVIITRVSQR